MLTPEDFDTHIYPELVDAISRGNDEFLTMSMRAAEGEARGYLSRFDRPALFALAGEARDPTLLLFLKDLTAWHYINLANANVDMALRKERYDMALDWLKGIQAGKIVPENWPLPEEETPGEGLDWKVSSQPKRETRY